LNSTLNEYQHWMAEQENAVDDLEPETNGRANPNRLKITTLEDIATTELEVAETVFQSDGEDFRFVRGMGWFTWKGTHWAPDESAELERRIIKMLRAMQIAAVNLGDTKGAEKARCTAKSFERAGRIKDVMDCLQMLKGIKITPADLDADPMLFNCTNGTVDLHTGELKPHRRANLITRVARGAYDTTVRAKHFCKFLEGVFPSPDIRAFAQRALGSALAGDTREHVLHVWHGNGANGKSTLANALLHALGEYGMTAAPKLLMVRRHSEHPTELADLRGRRFVVASESGEGARLDEEKIKMLTGGDVVKARHMRENYFQFTPPHTICLHTNHKPNIRGQDHAIWRRVCLWPFTACFTDPVLDMSDRLREDATPIVAWLVQGCIEARKRGLNPPAEVQAATSEYRQESDIVGRFVQERCVTGTDTMHVASTDLFTAFKSWMEDGNERGSWNQVGFANALKERGFVNRPHGPARRMNWFGLGLAEG